MEAELNLHGIAPLATHQATPPTVLNLGREGLRAILAAGHDPEVVVCSSDVLAQGALIEAQAQGIAVPERLGIMGFGDFDFAAFTHPPISSVHIDKQAIGAQAARSLIAKIEGRPLATNVIDVGFHLVERATTRSNA
jgi:LacI family gluconate utilization system Gnt-I transcriptional repressor